MTGPLDIVRRRLNVVPAAHRTHPVRTGAIVIALIALALFSGVTHNIPLLFGKHGRAVKLELASADQVSNRTVVRVGGIDVGRVEKVEPGSDPRRTSLVTLRLTDKGVEVHRDATAQVRWRTLLGGLMYIDLHPGSRSAPPLGDGTIPSNRTSSQVELDQFLQPYDGGTAQAQRNVFKGLSATFADPRGIDETLQTLSPTLRTVQRGTDPLRGTGSDDLRRLVSATARTVKGLDDTAALTGLVDGASRTLAATDAQRDDLGRFIELSPSSLDSTFVTMHRLRTTLDHLDPLAAALRPGARELDGAAQAATPAFVQARATLHEARPLLRAAAPTFDALRSASAAGVPLMEGLDPTLRRATENLLPFLRERDPGTRLRNYESIGPFFSALSMAAGEYDNAGYRIRFTVPAGNNSFISPIPESGR